MENVTHGLYKNEREGGKKRGKRALNVPSMELTQMISHHPILCDGTTLLLLLLVSQSQAIGSRLNGSKQLLLNTDRRDK